MTTGRAIGVCVSAALLWGHGVVWASADQTPGYPAIQRAFLREDFEQTASLAQWFLFRNPDVPEAPRVFLWLALSLDRLQRSTEALAELDHLKQRLPADDPLWPEALFWEGEVSRRSFQMGRAQAAYQQLLTRYPVSSWTSQAELGLGIIALHHQAFEAALGHFHDVALRQAGNPIALDATLLEGLCDLQMKRYLAAADLLAPLIEHLHDPVAMARAAFYLGESFGNLQRYDEAAVAYRQAIEVNVPMWSHIAQFGLGWALFQAGHCEDCAQVFGDYVKAPNVEHRTEALFAQASCWLTLGNEQEARGQFEQVVSRDPDHPLALESALIIADMYRREGRLVLAKELLHSFLHRYRAGVPQAHLQARLAALALEEGNAVQAKTIYALAQHSEDLAARQAALNGLGDVQMFLGDLAGANSWYERAAGAAPDTTAGAYAAYQAGRVALQLGHTDEAIARFQVLTTSSQAAVADDARVALIIARLNQQDADTARALITTLRTERRGTPVAARAAYYAALLAVANGEEAAAASRCEEAIAGAPSSDEALQAKLLLAELQAATPGFDLRTRLMQLYTTPGLSRAQRATLAERLGEAARRAGDDADAIRWYEAAMDAWPGVTGESVYWIASCYEDGNDVELAMRVYGQIQQMPWWVRGQLALAKLLEREERMDEAMAIYERLAKEPVPEAASVRERLAALRRVKQQRE